MPSFAPCSPGAVPEINLRRALERVERLATRFARAPISVPELDELDGERHRSVVARLTGERPSNAPLSRSWPPCSPALPVAAARRTTTPRPRVKRARDVGGERPVQAEDRAATRDRSSEDVRFQCHLSGIDLSLSVRDDMCETRRAW